MAHQMGKGYQPNMLPGRKITTYLPIILGEGGVVRTMLLGLSTLSAHGFFLSFNLFCFSKPKLPKLLERRSGGCVFLF